jgi:predicted methyltransferase
MRQSLIAPVFIALAAFGGGAAISAQSGEVSKELSTAIAAPHRNDANRARDSYRNPGPTLTFFGVKPTDKVVELWPGGGWYTEILAPYLSKKGRLTVATPDERRTDLIQKRFAANPDVFAKVGVATFPVKGTGTPVAPGSVDVVLTFRNVHNWRFGGVDAAQEAFNQAFAMLKPGGTLGVVEHRLPEDHDSAREEKSGYMKRSSVIAFAEKAGFKLVAESDINANPKDTHDWPEGVWTLPPNYRLGDVDKAKYAAIGESDRMTLKFAKPKR